MRVDDQDSGSTTADVPYGKRSQRGAAAELGKAPTMTLVQSQHGKSSVLHHELTLWWTGRESGASKTTLSSLLANRRMLQRKVESSVLPPAALPLFRSSPTNPPEAKQPFIELMKKKCFPELFKPCLHGFSNCVYTSAFAGVVITEENNNIWKNKAGFSCKSISHSCPVGTALPQAAVRAFSITVKLV